MYLKYLGGQAMKQLFIKFLSDFIISKVFDSMLESSSILVKRIMKKFYSFSEETYRIMSICIAFVICVCVVMSIISVVDKGLQYLDECDTLYSVVAPNLTTERGCMAWN